MALPDINFKKSYFNQKDNVVKDFLIPALKESYEYDRAVGFFSSTSLMSITVGIKNIIESGGRIKVICSPNLSSEDIDAINKGYELRKVVQDSLVNRFEEPKNEFEKERFNILCHLISNGIMDIKIAYMNSNNKNALFHPKLGILKDNDENFVVFNGSMNDSENAFYENEENIDVYTSFGSDFDRAIEKKNYFDDLWFNNWQNVSIIDFPEAIVSKIEKYKKDTVNFDIDKEEINHINRKKKYIPKVPDYIDIRDYQEEAYINWKNNNYIGIYDMATGAGKTYSALYSLVELLKEKNGMLGIIICCPYQHLVNQWLEDLDAFSFKYIVGFSGSRQKNWKSKLKDAIFNYNHRISDSFCFITTNASFATKYVQELLSSVKREMILVIDEAHNFGTYKLSRTLDNRFTYRLALSATIERHNDLIGTNYLYDYFQKKCISYTLKMAIDADKLVPYLYYPYKVYLNEDEYDEYTHLSSEIAKCIKRKEDGSIQLSKKAEMLLIKRSRLIAGAKSKLTALKEIAEKYKNDNHLLVYCGSTTVVDNDYDENKFSEDEIRQIDAASKVLNDLGIVSSQFTSHEDSKTREILKKEFDDGSVIQALVAIRCLDEGVNIPSVDKAIILASSTNPKEYVQRRGRLLRKYPGKQRAIIYDLITLPREIKKGYNYGENNYDISLIKREVKRLKDFASLSLNNYDSEKLISEIESVYGYIEENDDDECN